MSSGPLISAHCASFLAENGTHSGRRLTFQFWKKECIPFILPILKKETHSVNSSNFEKKERVPFIIPQKRIECSFSVLFEEFKHNFQRKSDNHIVDIRYTEIVNNKFEGYLQELPF